MLFYRADARHEIVCRESANYECAWLWQYMNAHGYGSMHLDHPVLHHAMLPQ